MEMIWRGKREKKAHLRNLGISMAKVFAREKLSMDRRYTVEEIAWRFGLSKRDIKYYLEQFFRPEEGAYVLNTEMREFLGWVLGLHERVLPALEQAKEEFSLRLKGYAQSGFDDSQVSRMCAELHDTILVLHWGLLPVYQRELMLGRGRTPEQDVSAFYQDSAALLALLAEVRGEGRSIAGKADLTLERELTCSIYSRRWGYRDVYYIKRTVDGWTVERTTMESPCEKDGTGAFFENLDADGVFYPRKEVGCALAQLWEQAEDGELSLDELQSRLQQLGDWISAVELAAQEGRPHWAIEKKSEEEVN